MPTGLPYYDWLPGLSFGAPLPAGPALPARQTWWGQSTPRLTWPPSGSPRTFGTSGVPGDQTTAPAPTGSTAPWAAAFAKGIPLLLAGLAPSSGGDVTGQAGTIQARAGAEFTTGQQLAGTGGEALNQALQYYRQLLSGDPALLASATAPERRRVIDAYDTAKRAAEFAPRGAEAGAMLNLGAKQASDLATLPLAARANAAQQLGQVGTWAAQLGTTAESSAQQSLAQALYPLLHQRDVDHQSIASTFAGLGEFLGPLILAAL